MIGLPEQRSTPSDTDRLLARRDKTNLTCDTSLRISLQSSLIQPRVDYFWISGRPPPDTLRMNQSSINMGRSAESDRSRRRPSSMECRRPGHCRH